MHLNILFIFSCLILFHETFSNLLEDPIVSLILKKSMNHLNFIKDKEFISHLNPKCVDDINLLIENAFNREIWALTMLDASVKVPNSIINSALNFVGDMDLCFFSEISSKGKMKTQHCLVQVPFKEEFLKKMIPKQELHSLKLFKSTPSVTYGVCLPKECSIKNITTIVDWYFLKLNMDNSILTEETCSNLNESSFRIRDWIALTIFIICGVIVFLSTTYDLLSIENPDRKELYKAFSWYSNGKRLFYGLDEAKEDYFTCIYGIRVITMIWIVGAHWVVIKIEEANMNLYSFLYEKEKTLIFTIAFSSFVSVDIFILISGILVANGFLITYNKYSFFKFNVFYLHRYLRTTPALVFVILFSTTLLRHLTNGPTWKSWIKYEENTCEENWYLNLLYLNNFFDDRCMNQTWYLSVDFQLFILSPIILIPLVKYPRYGNFVLTFFFFFGILLTFNINYFNQWDIGLFTSAAIIKHAFKYQYLYLHSHISPWIIGIYIGKKIYTNKNNKVFFSKIQLFAFWTLTLVAMVGSIFILYPFLQRDYTPNVFLSSLYISTSRTIFNLGIGWIIYACIYDYGGFINIFLSNDIFLPLGRLTYSIFLTHIIVQKIQLSSLWNIHYLSLPNEFFNIIANYFITLVPASIIYMTFEIPVANIEKYFFYQYLKRRKFDKEKLPLTKFSHE